MAERLNGHHKTHTHTHHGHTDISQNQSILRAQTKRRVGFSGQIELGQFAVDSHMTIGTTRSYLYMYIFIGYINILYICVWAALWGSDFYRSSDKRSATDHKRKDNNSDWDG